MMCFPFIWMILTSFKTYGEAITNPPTILPLAWWQRLQITLQLMSRNPLVPIAFLAWIVIGLYVARLIHDRRLAAIYLVVHAGVFLAVGNMDSWGAGRLATLWRSVEGQSGIALEGFWSNYAEAWARAPFALYFRNSLTMSLLTPMLIILTTAPAAYAFARLTFPGKHLLFMLYLATMMVPSEVVLIPNFITISELGWRNTFAALVIPFSVSVMTIFFLRQFFLSLPNEMFDAATIDGAGHVRFLLAIAIPLARPALVSTAMFNFLYSWNALIWPLLVTDNQNMRPIALGLASFSTEAGMQPQLYMAAATFTIAPVIILFLFVQRQFIEGIARSGIK